MSLAKVIGNNILALMKKQNVKIKQLADLIGVTRQTMTKYLEGEVIIDSEKLFKIAEFFGKPLDYFLENKHEEMAFLFRAHALNKESISTVQNKICDLINRVYEIYELAGEKISYLPQQYNLKIDSKEKQIPKEIKLQIEQIALEEREWLNIGESRGEEIIECFENKGIRIIFEKFDMPVMFGVSALHDQKGCFIVINDDENIPEERKIFSIVHEYAHILFDRNQYRQVILQSTHRNIYEKIADKFAGYFLIPRKSLAKYSVLLKSQLSWNDLIYIKKDLRVNLKALLHVLNDYEYISDKEYQKWLKYLNMKGYTKKEPDPMPYFKKNTAHEKIVRMLFMKEQIGINKVAELLGISVEEARENTKKWMMDERED